MATKKKPTYANPNFKGFVSYTLDESERKLLKARAFTDEDFSTWLWRYVENGYKFTFTWFEKQRAYQCTATHTDEKHDNFGLFLSGRGSSPLKAFKQWVYIHTDVCAEVWGEYVNLNRDDEIDD